MRFFAKSTLLRAASLLFAAIAVLTAPARAQQEVAPEHFDAQPVPQAKKPTLPPKPASHVKPRQNTSNQRAASRQDAVVFKSPAGRRQRNTSPTGKRARKQKTQGKPKTTAQVTTRERE